MVQGTSVVELAAEITGLPSLCGQMCLFQYCHVHLCKTWKMWSLLVQIPDSQLASLFYLAQSLTTFHCLSFHDCQQPSVSQAISDSWGIHDGWSMWAVKDHSLAYRRKTKMNKKKMKCKETWIKNLMAITDYMIDKRNIT